MTNAHNDAPAATPLMTRRQAVSALGASAALAALVLAGGCACTPNREPLDIDPVEEWKSPYDWNALMSNEQGRKFYYPNSQLSSRVGIDISDHKGEVDWAAVAADGIEFAMVRVGYRGYTEGGIFLDQQFRANIEGARANGIAVGAYFFSSAVNAAEAREEAAFVIEQLAGFELEYPIAYDQEKVPDTAGRANNLSSEQYTANAAAFCEAVEQAGYDAMVYGNKHHLALLDLDLLGGYPLWYAEYGVNHPTGHFNFTIWQHSESAPVAGVGSTVDMNIHFLAQ